MSKIRLFVLLFAAVFAMTAVFVGCDGSGAGNDNDGDTPPSYSIDPELAGAWEYIAAGRVLLAYTFNSDGTYFIDGEKQPFKVMTKNDTIYTAESDKEVKKYSYKISGGTLTLTNLSTGNKVADFTKEGSGGSNNGSGNNVTFDLELVGIWVSPSGTHEFRSDRTYLRHGVIQPDKLVTRGGVIYSVAVDNVETEIFRYAILSNGTELILTYDGGGFIELTKQQGSGRDLDPRLVGTWELLVDGAADPNEAYTFNSDGMSSYNGIPLGKLETENGKLYPAGSNSELFTYVISPDGQTLSATTAGITLHWAKK
ncbi:MAG: hypothetical protein FWE57_01650 [Chitinispirillia bacterium]|nr:hypothetical protein [Chitinispirillia bacterium]